MIAVAIALVVAGLLLGLFIPPYGFVGAGIGLVLLVVWLVGAGRRAHDAGAEPR
jgi:O-antigen/teichoic acid export membrane protein